MQIKKTNKTKTQVLLSISVSENELQPIKYLVLKKLAANMKSPGFRVGKIPLELAEKQIDQSLFQSEFLDTALNQLYIAALDEHHLRPVSRPEVNIKKFVPFSALEFEAAVEVVGSVSLGYYKKLTTKRTEPVVQDEEVTAVIDNLRQREAVKTDVKRVAKIKDQVWIDFSGVDSKGEPVAGAEGKEYPIVLGSNTFIPGFEDNVLGLKAGDTKTFDVTFPRDYRVSTLRGKKVKFTVVVNKVQEVTLPKLDDTFAASVGPVKSISALKSDIKKELLIQKTQEVEDIYRSALVSELSDKSSVDIPEVLIEEQVEKLLLEIKQNATYRGQTWAEFLAAVGKTEEEYKVELRQPAQLRVKSGLVLGEVVDKEGLSVTSLEVEERITNLKRQYQDKAMQDELDKPSAKQDIASRILTEKAIAVLTQKQ